MKIKMVKMGLDIDSTRNHRIRGIVPTKDDKYVFIEILQGNRVDRRYTSLSNKEYELKYPNLEYIVVDSCFRVDIPKEYFNNYSPEFKEIIRNSYYELAYTKENIVKLLQTLNKDIEDIDLVDEYYIDKFCEDKGFFRLYDDRLKHFYKPIEIVYSDLKNNGDTRVKQLYTCYAVNGTEYSEELEVDTTIDNLIKENGKEIIQKLVNDYVEKMCEKINNKRIKEEYCKANKELFENCKNDLEIEENYIEI